MSDRLWAPWRMQFIRDSDRPAGCALCAYVGVEPSSEGRVLAREPHAFVVLNKFPYAAGHLLVVPTRHVASLEALTPDEHAALWALTTQSATRLERATGAEGLNLGMNLGRAAGAGIREHLHVHLVPRWVGDNNFMPVVSDVRVMPEYLEATWEALWPHFAPGGAGL
ncbi:MAG: HIT domain-containing protein [Polyangiaceae bacterium]|nr:HIT domain-containing protein [Polyangiaceae bacterium]